jgi:hypothetical protein
MQHLTSYELQEYIDRVLDARKQAEVESHLGGCRECSDRCAALRLIDAELRRMPLERVSANFTERVMRSLRLDGRASFFKQLTVNLLPLIGAMLAVVVVVALFSAKDVAEAGLPGEAQRYVQTYEQTVGDLLSSGSTAVFNWVKEVVGVSSSIPSLKFIIGLFLAFGAVALFDEFVFVPMMRKKG